MNTKGVRILLGESASCEASQGLRALYADTPGGVELTIVSTIGTVLPTMKVVNPEVLLLDLALLQPDYQEMVRHIHRAAPNVPLIIVAEPSEKKAAEDCLKEGAMDYLLKNYMDQKTLGRVMKSVLEQNTLKGLTDLLRDTLTGLYIREGFLTLGSQAVEAARRSGRSMVLLCALCENLPAIRQEFGPGTAEQSICDAAQIISRCFRRTDLAARIGEGQFAALAVDATESSASMLCQRIEKQLALHNQEREAWGPLKVRLSAGCWNPQDSRTFPELLDSVEQGLRFVPAELQYQIPERQLVNPG